MRDRLDEGPGNAIILSMSHSDIDDYLGLTIETICRTLTALWRQGLVSLCKSFPQARRWDAGRIAQLPHIAQVH
ncbi:helix-turn-helix domain-containing protein [Granulibacter bethesdensis]|uniref:helix-turn-helix domain-containing protein n=1 Tax=Granulibacter bethesdensis TaxID=364410 RepID=UPI0012FE2119|nr:helix-turn-helix domain-containing protein [Granulibacter bethesdensis]